MNTHDLHSRHSELLSRAITAISDRTYFSAFKESFDDNDHESGARSRGEAAFKASLRKRHPVDIEEPLELAGPRKGPYGLDLDVRYADLPVQICVDRAKRAALGWAALPFAERAGICIELLHRLDGRAFEMAHACMHSCGQPFAMAFQAGTAHALDRGLEAIAYAVREMSALPAKVLWEKPAPKGFVRVEKTFDIVPQGIAAIIGCSTFPTWNSYSGIFASLVTGNPIIVKPHPAAILPLAIFVDTAKALLKELALDGHIVQLLVDSPEKPKTKVVALHPDVRLIDFTGSSHFGDWLEKEAKQATVFTEKSGINALIIHSTGDFSGMTRNIAVTLSLYSGQMCTTPQSIYVPMNGIDTPEGIRSADEFKQALSATLTKLTADPVRAIELLGVIQSPATVHRIEEAATLGEVALESRSLVHPTLPDAALRTPMLIQATPATGEATRSEYFGPISFLIDTDTADEALTAATATTIEKGAISWSVYSIDEAFTAKAKACAARAGVHLTLNMTGAMLVNQSAAFSDFHVSGHNPAGNASITDGAFVLPRFRVLQTRRFLS